MCKDLKILAHKNLNFMKHSHLIESQMSYRQHLVHSIKQSTRLVVIAVKSLIHGVFPGIYVNSGPLGVYQIYKEIKKFEHVKKILGKDD
jgi:hypothetical protein